MAENVKVEIDLATGKLGLECPESSIESIFTRLEDFLPKFREQAQHGSRHVAHHAQQAQEGEPQPTKEAKAANGSVPNSTKRRGSTAGRAGAALETRPEVQSLQLSVDEPSLIAWDSLDKDWKKYLWILEAARVKGVDGLTNGEISYLMDKTFREVRIPKVINNIRQKIKARFVQSNTVNIEGRTYSVWRILAAGSKEVVQPEGGSNT